MKTIIKNKKLYIIILAFFSVLIIAYGILYKKIEAPNTPQELSVIGIVENSQVVRLLPSEKNNELKEINNVEKYKIISRSIVVPENILNKQKIILLTIDDGPSVRTEEMIKVLEKHNAKAIFFINGIHDKNNPGVVKQIETKGFAVGNHTWDHLNLKREKDNKIIEKEIIKNTELITKITSKPPRFFRAPYGESNSRIRKFVKDNDMIFMDWSGAAKDWEKSTKEKDIFVSNVMNNVHSGSIILIHEHPWSLENLDALLTTLDSNGYVYVDPANIIE